ncbi:MAG: glycosyltransferase, partial [Nitrosopumilaceae archaeon]
MIFKKLAKKGLGIYKNVRRINVLKAAQKVKGDADSLKVIGFVKCFNEGTNGNLERCLTHLSTFCNEIVFCDDSSTDNSLEIARKYTNHIIQMPDDFKHGLLHKQKLLELALSLKPDWIVSL